LNEKLIN